MTVPRTFVQTLALGEFLATVAHPSGVASTRTRGFVTNPVMTAIQMAELTSRTVETDMMILTQTLLRSAGLVQSADSVFRTRAVVRTHSLITSSSCPSTETSTFSSDDIQERTLVLRLNAECRLDAVRVFVAISSEISATRVLIASFSFISVLTLAVRSVLLLLVRARTKDRMCTIVRTQRGGTRGIAPSREAFAFRGMSVLVVSMRTYSSVLVTLTLLILQFLGLTLGKRKRKWWW